MEDLTYIFNLGFSGSDLWRAIIIAFFAAMFVTKSRNAAIMGLWALLVDRLIWPLTDMTIRGADQEILSQVFNGMMQSIGADLGLYVVRFAGLVMMIYVFTSFRRRIHKPRLDKLKTKPKPAYG